MISILTYLMTSCNGRQVTYPITPTPVTATVNFESTHKQTPIHEEPTVFPSITPENSTPVAIYLVPQNADQKLAEILKPTLNELVTQAGYDWQMRSMLSPDKITPDIKLVIVLPPDPGIRDLVKASTNTFFLAIGIEGIEPGPNLSVIGVGAQRPDQEGFIAGVMAAVVTEDWRVATIGPPDVPASQAARQAFITGVVYFCGLCRPIFPPFYSYPQSVDLPVSSTPAEKQAIVDYLKDQYIHTVYLAPGMNDPELIRLLESAGVQMIGSEGPSDEYRSHWIASIRPEYNQVVKQVLSDLIKGQAGADLDLTLTISDINPDLLSPGRQGFVQKVLDDLLAGYIDTGVRDTTDNEK